MRNRGMVRQLLLAGGVATGLLGTMSASAQQAPGTPAASVYFGVGLGASRAAFKGSEFTPVLGSTASDETETAGSFKFSTGFRVTRHVGFELSAAWLGTPYKFTSDLLQGGAVVGSVSSRYRVSSWNLAGVGRLPLGTKVALQGKMGAAFTRVENSVSITAAGLTSTTREGKARTNFLWGLGAGYEFANGVELLLEYESYGQVGNNDETGRARISLVTANMLFKF